MKEISQWKRKRRKQGGGGLEEKGQGGGVKGKEKRGARKENIQKNEALNIHACHLRRRKKGKKGNKRSKSITV